jgi:hypothetical protein
VLMRAMAIAPGRLDECCLSRWSIW